MSEYTRAHVFVSGRVQGVFFRSTTLTTARTLGLRGWVRNLDDGRVEAVFEGPRAAVEAAIAWCADGPPGASVESLEIGWKAAEGLGEFEIR